MLDHDQLIDIGVDLAMDVGFLDPMNYTHTAIPLSKKPGQKAINDPFFADPPMVCDVSGDLEGCMNWMQNTYVPEDYCGVNSSTFLGNHKRRQTMLEWRVVRNDPAQNGIFGPFLYEFQSNMPMPRLSQGVKGVRAFNGTPFTIANHAFGDFNGDGFADRLLPDRNGHQVDMDGFTRPVNVRLPDDDKRFVVWGDRTGLPWPATSQEWQMPDSFVKLDRSSAFLTDNGGSNGALEHLHTLKSHNTLLDFNGDGLPDLVASGGFGLVYFPNYGKGFQSDSILAKTGIDAISTVEVDVVEAVNSGHLARPTRANQKTLRKTLDFNGDGLLDIVEVNPLTKQVSVWANNGFTLASQTGYIHSDESKVAEAFLAEIRMGDAIPEVWQQWADFSDFTGDGHADVAVTEGFNRKLYKATYPVPPQFGTEAQVKSQFETPTVPPFRLRTIVSPHSAITTVRYASSNDSNVVRQDPENGYTIRKPRWVVKSISVNPGGSQPSMATDYVWVNPVWKRDLYGHWGFRGFQESGKVAPSGAQTVSRFDYDQHYAGLLAEAGDLPRRGFSQPASYCGTQLRDAACAA